VDLDHPLKLGAGPAALTSTPHAQPRFPSKCVDARHQPGPGHAEAFEQEFLDVRFQAPFVLVADDGDTPCCIARVQAGRHALVGGQLPGRITPSSAVTPLSAAVVTRR
jgi:hypothetical protein